ncbi:Metallo-dependent hydrolase [Suillus occidentalis]|nr:Metallo-dependent hydrolase [Suillus occidentalis]
MSEITRTGPAAAALASLRPDDVNFLQSLPKAELHAHLNGSIPIKTLLELEQQYSNSSAQTPEITDTIEKFKSGIDFNEISDFFSLMTAIYALTTTPEAVETVTRAVLQSFLNPTGDGAETSQCTYLELRTTPRATIHMTRERYLTIVLDELETYPATQAALIVSVDRRMNDLDVEECISLAIEMKNRGRRVVGVDVCGDPRCGDMQTFTQHLSRAKAAGLGLTVHIAEVCNNTTEDCLALLSCRPDRLGHATFLSDELKALFFADIPLPGTESQSPNNVRTNSQYKPCVEICLSSNLLGKNVASLDAHHIRYYLKNDHPIAICTDDALPFRTSCLGEYSLLLAQPPLGLGLSRDDVAKVARMGMDAAFLRPRD